MKYLKPSDYDSVIQSYLSQWDILNDGQNNLKSFDCKSLKTCLQLGISSPQEVMEITEILSLRPSLPLKIFKGNSQSSFCDMFPWLKSKYTGQDRGPERQGKPCTPQLLGQTVLIAELNQLKKISVVSPADYKIKKPISQGINPRDNISKYHNAQCSINSTRQTMIQEMMACPEKEEKKQQRQPECEHTEQSL